MEGAFPSDKIASSQWNFTVGQGAKVFDHLQKLPKKLGDEARIWQGMVTGADKVFVVEKLDDSRRELISVRDSNGETHDLERPILRRFLKDVSLWPFSFVEGSHYLVFPYAVTDKGATLLTPKEMKSTFPMAWRFLNSKRKILIEREGGTWDHDQWYAFGRSQNLTQMEGDKLVVQVIAQSPRFSFDSGNYYFTGGGNGPYYGVRWINPDEKRSLHYLQAVLNSRIADYFIRSISTPFRGGYWSYGKRFIEQIPMMPCSPIQEALLLQIVLQLLWLTRHFVDHGADQSARDPLMLAYFEQILNGMVYELYFPEEVNGAGLHLFDLVEQAALPALETIPETKRLTTLRPLFEALYDGTHPLKISLQKLQTLDTVRIIEGKA